VPLARARDAMAEECVTAEAGLQPARPARLGRRWYRRAWFDNGDVLGSQANTECRIDLLPQSWATLIRASASPGAAGRPWMPPVGAPGPAR
jgi:cyclic beta-1,2-glucan synthetase